jgi:hypothetical protein
MKNNLQSSSTKENLPSELSQPASSNATGLPASERAVQPGPRLVYVVENDRISSVITELIVKKNLFGGEVRCYTNGQRAFDEFSLALQQGASLPDLVILDLDICADLVYSGRRPREGIEIQPSSRVLYQAA